MIFKTLKINNKNLYSIADKETRNMANTYIEEMKEKELLKGYFGIIAKNIYVRTRVKNSEILELFIYGAYIEEQSKLEEKEKQIMYEDANYYYQKGQKEVSNTLKKKKPISIIDMALFLYLLDQPNYSGFNLEQYIEIAIRNNAYQLYKQALINIQQQRELEIENSEFQRIINQQSKQKLCINKDKISGYMDTQLIGINNLAKLEGIKELDCNAKVKFIAILDDKETDMCHSLNNQEFYINKENVFNRYYGETQKELRIERIRCNGLVLGLNLPPISHHFHWCRSYIVYIDKNINVNNAEIKKRITRSLNKNLLKYNTNGISKMALLENFSKSNKVLKDFPTLKNKINVINIREDRDYSMAIKPYKNGYKLFINKDVFNSRKTAKNNYIELVKLGYSPKGTTYKDILTHELGHATVFEIIKNKYKGNSKLARHDWENSITSTEIVNKAFDNLKIRTYDQKRKIISDLSKYSLENASETIGESFSDYYSNGKKAKRISKEIVNIMKGMI